MATLLEVQTLLHKFNNMIQAPVSYDLVMDGQDGEPTYTLVQLTFYPDLDKPGREQVVAGKTINEVQEFIRGMIESMNVMVEFFTIEYRKSKESP